MSTPFNYFGDLEGASSYLSEADKKLNLLWEGRSVCLTDDDIEQLENQFRVIRNQISKLRDKKDKFKALTILRSENTK